MFGKMVYITFQDEDIEISMNIRCNPDTPDSELKELAFNVLMKSFGKYKKNSNSIIYKIGRCTIYHKVVKGNKTI